jgi:hypothetical protein
MQACCVVCMHDYSVPVCVKHCMFDHHGACCCAALLPVAEPCTAGGTCLPGGGNILHTINFNRLPYAMSVERGGVLVFGYVQLFNLAPAAAYSYSTSTPWRSTGQGTTSWPSIGLAPNATVCVVICLCVAHTLQRCSWLACLAVQASASHECGSHSPLCMYACLALPLGPAASCTKLGLCTDHNVHLAATRRRGASAMLPVCAGGQV